MIKTVSLFSGGGGIDLGFQNAGYKITFSTDHWDIATETLSKNFPETHVIHADVREINYNKVKEVSNGDIDVLVGGPPCPAYSKSRFYLKDKKRALDDESSFTLYEYIRALEELEPRVFFFENVNGFVFKPHKAALDLLKAEADRLGYEISYEVLNAADYGVPQTRKRFICVGIRKDENKKFVFPKPTHIDPDKEKDLFTMKLKPWITAGEAIGDLDYDLPEDKDKQAGSKHKELLREIPPGDNYLYFTEKRGHPDPKFKWRSRYWSFLLKLSPNRPSWTIQASFSNNMGPFHWKNRFLRIEEIKRFQTFPDDYKFSGEFIDQWRQIGNAVPVKLVETIAEEIKKQVFGGE